MMKLPIGYDNFAKVRQEKLDFIDKSLFIQEIIDDKITEISVMVRPHALIMGITANLYNNGNYELRSNKESGYGLYDYMILSKDLKKPTLLLEFKQLKSSEKIDPNKLGQQLEKLAEEALAQIDVKRYTVEAQQRGVKNLLKIGLSFSGKHFKIKYKSIHL